MKVELTATKLSFSGENKWRKYALDLEFYAEIDEKLSKTHHSGRGVEFVLRKKEIKAEFWPRLAKEPKKLQFIKTDFNKVCDPSCLSARCGGSVMIPVLIGIRCSGSMRMSRMRLRSPPSPPATTWTATWTVAWAAWVAVWAVLTSPR